MTASAPLISIVLPVRNGEKYLAQTLDSLFAQTYQNFNILVLENSSSDATPTILSAVSDQRLRVFPSDRPLSIDENWARILALPLAEWMTIISHDDLLYPSFLQTMIDLSSREPQASLFSAQFDMIDPDGTFIRRSRPIPYSETGDDFLRARQRYDRDSFGTGYFMRSQDYIRVGGLPPFPQLFFADDMMVYRLAQHSHKITSPDVHFAYRYHRYSAAYTVPLETLYQASRQYLDALKESGYMDTQENAQLARHYIEKTFDRRYHRFLVDLILANDSAEIAAYKHTRQQLSAWEKADQLFSVYDPASRAIDFMLRIPIPAVRYVAARLIEGFAVITRRIRKL